MKNEVNRAIMAKKKLYNQPQTDVAQLEPKWGLMQIGLGSPTAPEPGHAPIYHP